jgi:hypothetical protein
MNQLHPEPVLSEPVAPANQPRFTNEQKVARLFTAGSMGSFAFPDERVVVIVPSGNYNDPCELGRYKNIQIAFQIVKALDLCEYRLFSLDSGDELFVQ